MDNSVTLDEMKAYYAFCILMAQIKETSIQMYWFERTIVEMPIKKK